MPSQRQAVESAYERGDFAETRRLATAILGGNASDEDKARARELLSRVTSDRAVLVLLAACVVFFLVIVLTYAGRI